MAKPTQVMREQRNKIEEIDQTLARAAGGKRNTMMVQTAGSLSDLADQPPLIALSLLTIGAGLFSESRPLSRVGVRMLLSHLLATQAKSFVKHRIDRTRPFVMLDGGSYHGRKGESPAKQENSFPSGHTAGAVAVARAITREFPESAAASYGAASMAAVLQLPRAAHFASDVIVGALIGIASEAVVALIMPVAEQSGT
jgi:membrane-associated phospholipid phosphatase